MKDGRSHLLDLYARFERPLLRLNYRLVRSRWATWRPVRWLIGRLLLDPIGRFGATGQPLTLPEAIEHIENSGKVAVGPCGCRSTHHGCQHPIMTDVLINAGVAAWQGAFPQDYREATKDEIVALFRDCRRQGMIQVLYRSGMGGGAGYAICNCCRDGCIPILNRQLYPGYRFDPGVYEARVDLDACIDCGRCQEVCPFGARRDTQTGRMEGCLGCGLCADYCPRRAIGMVRRENQDKAMEAHDRDHGDSV